MSMFYPEMGISPEKRQWDNPAALTLVAVESRRDADLRRSNPRHPDAANGIGPG